ncbi:hypothetical protein [Streptomyces sp. NBC_00239]|uniref:hypothetical protein n=1 Tax=Streptomyces sp. NBC_00239 TaxID=2903640 RepID=UPI002E29AC01|nr:hypothetical protein [Streptomyces sp. NBC_00239]
MRSRLALARAAGGGRAAASLIGEAAVRNASSASITTQQLETLPVDRRETETYVESAMAALEEFSAHAAQTMADTHSSAQYSARIFPSSSTGGARGGRVGARHGARSE